MSSFAVLAKLLLPLGWQYLVVFISHYVIFPSNLIIFIRLMTEFLFSDTSCNFITCKHPQILHLAELYPFSSDSVIAQSIIIIVIIIVINMAIKCNNSSG